MATVRGILFAATLFVPFSAAQADATEDADQAEQIVLRCHYYVGEFGVDVVRACVDEEQRARQALLAYPPETTEIVSRCTRHVQVNGWAMAKLCADQDIEAEVALARYPKGTEAAVEGCRQQMGTYGAAKVKACADQRLETLREVK